MEHAASFRRLDETSKTYYRKCYTFSCGGDKCRRTGKTAAEDGYSMHCEGCHGYLDDDYAYHPMRPCYVWVYEIAPREDKAKDVYNCDTG